MKYIKLLSIWALALSLFACSDDDNGNKADVKIGFAAAEQDYGYNDFLYIPIKAQGEVDGDINIQIDVKEYTGNFAVKENVDYIITSKKLVLKKGMSEVNVEIRVINKPDEARFALSINHVSHADVNENTKETLISIAKTDFDRLTGVYNFAGTKIEKTGKSPISFPLTVGVEKANEEFNVAGWNGEDDAFIMEYDAANEQVSIPSLNVMGAYNFDIGPHFIALCTYSKISGQITGDPVVGSWDEFFSEITLDNTYGLVVALFTYPDGNPTNYIYGPKIEDFTMIRATEEAETGNVQTAGFKVNEKLIHEAPEMFRGLKEKGFKLNVSKQIECYNSK